MEKTRLSWEDFLKKIREAKENPIPVAIIDNSPPPIEIPRVRPRERFLWVDRWEEDVPVPFPAAREKITRLFRKYGIEVEEGEKVVVFHHHDGPPFKEEEGVIFVEFSHQPGDCDLYSSVVNEDYLFVQLVVQEVFEGVVEIEGVPPEVQVLKDRFLKILAAKKFSFGSLWVKGFRKFELKSLSSNQELI